MKKILALILAIMMLASLSVVAFADDAVETTHITFALNRSEDDVVGKALKAASEKLYEDTNGAYDLEIYFNGTYGTNLEAMQAVLLGDLDGTCFDSGMDYAIRFGILQVPYTFPGGYDHWLAFKDSEVYQEYLADFNETVGVHHFGFYTFGLRYVTGNEKWTHPDDLKDVKMRVATLPPYSEYGVVLNANTAPLEATELYVALQNGVFDAQENSLPDMISRKLYEVQDYIMGTRHALSCGGFACSTKLWESLDADAQAALDAAFNYAIDYIDQDTINSEEATIEWLGENGCEYVEVDSEAFAERAPLIFEKFPEFEYYWAKIQEVEY